MVRMSKAQGYGAAGKILPIHARKQLGSIEGLGQVGAGCANVLGNAFALQLEEGDGEMGGRDVGWTDDRIRVVEQSLAGRTGRAS